jgi:hypothetical protein
MTSVITYNVAHSSVLKKTLAWKCPILPQVVGIYWSEAEAVKLNPHPDTAESKRFVTVKVIQQEKGTRSRCVLISEKPVYGADLSRQQTVK